MAADYLVDHHESIYAGQALTEQECPDEAGAFAKILEVALLVVRSKQEE